MIVVLCQQTSREWILDHESELPPRVPFMLGSADRQYAGQVDRHPSLLDDKISCAENLPCCILPTLRLPEVQVAFKMGASEPMDQVYSNLNHTSKCIPNILVVSDKEQKVGRFHAHDVIADLPPWYRKHNKEFKDYDNLNKPDTDASSISYANGHRLDKLKFLPMIEYAYKTNPTAKWFIFLEADTFIAWNNVFQLLDQYNHSLPLYFGSPAPGRILPDGKKTWFAYGGTGYVLSSAAMDLLLSGTDSLHGQYLPRLSEQFQTLIKEDCCGDSVLGYALAWKGIPLTGLNPMFNPHSLHMLSFSTSNWCVPIISIHKAHGQDISGLSDFAAANNKSVPINSSLLHADLFQYLQLPHIEILDNWDSTALVPLLEVESKLAHESFAACAEACYDHTDCFQFTYKTSWRSKQCLLTSDIKRGQRRDPELNWRGRTTYKSGWDIGKIQKFADANRCVDAEWVLPGINH